MSDRSRLKQSVTTRAELSHSQSRSRSRGPSYEPSTDNARSSRSPTYSRQQMYTFSPRDKVEDDQITSEEMNNLRRTLVEKSNQNRLVESQVKSPRAYSNQARLYESSASQGSLVGRREQIIERLRSMGQNIDYLIRRTSSHSQQHQGRLLHLKALIQEIFVEVSDEIEQLKYENSELRKSNREQQSRELRNMQENFTRRINQLEQEKSRLEQSIRQMSNAIERGRALQEDLMRKGKEIDKLNRIVDDLENERQNNHNQISKMKDKLDELADERNRIRREASDQEHILSEMKQEAQSAIESNRKTERRLKDAQSHIVKTEDQVANLNRVNKDLSVQINALNQEKNRIQQRSRQDIEELMHLKEINKEMAAKLQGSLARLKEQVRMKEDYEVQINQLRQAFDGERRKTESIRQQADNRIRDEKEKLNRKIEDYESKLANADKRLKDFQRSNDAAQSQFETLKKQLDGQRRRSMTLDRNLAQFQKLTADEKKALLDRLQEEKANAKRQGHEIRDYAKRLQQSQGLVRDFGRKSEMYENEIDSLRQEINKDRRKSALFQEQANRKIKALIDQNGGLNRKLQEDQDKNNKNMQTLKEYENKYRDYEKKYQDQTRKSDMYNEKMNEIMGQLEKERRMSMMNMREKQEVIKKLEQENNKLADKIDKEADEFKKKQSDFFNRNKDLERILQENARKSDVMAKQLMALKEEYDKERRKSTMHEENEQKLNERMKDLSNKYGMIAQKLEQNQDKYIKKENLCNLLEGKYKQIERLFLQQTRKSQLDEEQIKKLYGEIESQRRKSMANENDSKNKIKMLVDKNNELNGKLTEGQEKHQKQLALMKQFEEKAKEYEGRYHEMSRKSDMNQKELNALKGEIQKDRRRSLVLDQEQKSKIKALEEKNLKILQKLQDDREKFSRTAENLKETEAKYKLIEKLLDDERRASMINVEQLRRLGIEMDNERRKSMTSQQQHKKRLEMLNNQKHKLAAQAEDLRQALSEKSRTINSLETKASRSERNVEQLSNLTQQLARQKQKAEHSIQELAVMQREKDMMLRKEIETREEALRDLNNTRQALSQAQNDLRRLTNAMQNLERQMQARSRNLSESNQRNRFMADALNEMKATQQKLNARISQLYNINVQNAALFQKNFKTLKSQIDHRNNDIEGKEKRINLLERQVVEDSRRVVAILPNSDRKAPNYPDVHMNPELRRRL